MKWIFSADTAPYRSALNKMREETNSFSGSVKGQIAGIFGGGALLAGAGKIIEKFARIKDLADRFGESAESIQRVGAAAAQAGTDVEGIAKGMTAATKNAVEAASGNDDLAAAFDRMGVSAGDFANMSIEDKILALAGGYDEASNKGVALSDVMKIAGKSGAEMIPLLTGGADAVQDAFDKAKIAGEGTVNTIGGLDDRLEELKGTIAVWAAWLIAKIATVTSIWGIAWMAVFDLVGDGFDLLVVSASKSMAVISNVLTGNFQGAKKAADEYFQGVKGGLENIAKTVQKTGESIGGAWDDAGAGPEHDPSKDPANIENAKAAADAKLSAMKEQQTLAQQIADLEEKARLDQLNLTEKILDAEKRRAALAAQSDTGDENTDLARKRDILKIDANLAELHKQDDAQRLQAQQKIADAHAEWNKVDLENKRSGMSDNDKIKSLREEQAALNKQAREAKAKGDDVNAVKLGKQSWGIEDRIKGLQSGIDDAKGNYDEKSKESAFKKMSPMDQIKSLAADRKKAKEDSEAAFQKGDTKTGYEQKTKALDITGQIGDIKDKQKSEIDANIEKMQALDAKSSIKASSLADVGGGGGVSVTQADHSAEIAKGIQELVSLARAGNENLKPGAPEPNY